MFSFGRNYFYSFFFTVFRIRIRFDLFHFGQPDQGSKKTAKIMENFHKKINQNLKNIVHFFLINNKTENFSEKYIFSRSQVGFEAESEDPDPDSYQNETDP